MQLASGTLASLHQLGPVVKAFLAGVMGFGFPAGVGGLFATAASGMGLGFWFSGGTPNYGYLFLGLLIFYAGCVGLGLLNTGLRHALRIALVGVFSAALAWPVILVLLGLLATSVQRYGCPECEFLRYFFGSSWTWLPALVPAIVILALSISMSQARWRGMGAGVISSLLLGAILSAILAYWNTKQISAIGPVMFSGFGVLFGFGPLSWALITYGTLRVKGNPDGEHLARIRSG